MIFPRMTPAWSGQDNTHPLPTLHSLSLFLFLGIEEYINYIFYVYINMVTSSCSILQGDGLLKRSKLCTVSQNTAVFDSLLATPLPPHQPPPSHLELYLHVHVLSASLLCSHVSEQYGQQVATPLKTLVQHLCTKVPDRAEYRSKVAVVGLCCCYSLYH